MGVTLTGYLPVLPPSPRLWNGDLDQMKALLIVFPVLKSYAINSKILTHCSIHALVSSERTHSESGSYATTSGLEVGIHVSWLGMAWMDLVILWGPTPLLYESYCCDDVGKTKFGIRKPWVQILSENVALLGNLINCLKPKFRHL